MLPEGELQSLRSEVEAWFTDTCDIYTVTSAEDEFGGEGVATETPKASGVRCMIESGAAHEQTRAMIGKIAGVQLFLVSLPQATDIELDDHLVVTTQNNLHMRVQAVMSPESYEMEKRVIASTLGEHNA